MASITHLPAQKILDAQDVLSRIVDLLNEPLSQNPDRGAPYTLILGAGGSVPIVPTVRQMVEEHIPQFLLAGREDELPIDLRQETPENLRARSAWFWQAFLRDNPELDERCRFLCTGESGLPDDWGNAYRAVFTERHRRGFGSPHKARRFLRQFNARSADGRIRLNGTHFYLASILGLQPPRSRDSDGTPRKNEVGQPLFTGVRPFLQTILTTNFDPLLQISLQAVNILYYVTDRPEFSFSPEPEDPLNGTIHLMYVHGSLHRGGLANHDDTIGSIAHAHDRDLDEFFRTRGVLVLGYSGWDDVILQSLERCGEFSNNLYWFGLAEEHLTQRARQLISSKQNAFFVKIAGGGQFFSELHARLCPGLRQPELIERPLPMLCELLGGIDLRDVDAYANSARPSPEQPMGALLPEGVSGASTPGQWLRSTISLLEKCDKSFFRPRQNASDTLADVLGPELPTILLRQADLRFSAQQYADALPFYESALQRDATDFDVPSLALGQFRRARCYGKLGDTFKEIEGYTRVIDMPGAPVDILAKSILNRGICYGQVNEPQKELDAYATLISRPDVPGEIRTLAHLNRGVCHEKAERFEVAIADFTKVVEAVDAPARALFPALVARANCKSRMQDVAGAIADYEKVIESTDAGEQVLRALEGLARLFQQAGQREKALECYSRILQAHDASSEVHARAHYNRGHFYQSQGQLDLALADYARALEIPGAPAHVVAASLCNRGIHLYETGQHELAFQDFARLLEGNYLAAPKIPDDVVAAVCLYRGWYSLSLGENERAIADLSTAMEKSATSKDLRGRALAHRGFCYFRTGAVELAAADYTKVLEMDQAPNDALAMALGGRGICYGTLGAAERSSSDLARFFSLQNIPLDTLGWVLLQRATLLGRQGRLDLAANDVNRLNELHGVRPEISTFGLLLRAMLSRIQGDVDAALADEARALELCGGNEKLRCDVATLIASGASAAASQADLAKKGGQA